MGKTGKREVVWMVCDSSDNQCIGIYKDLGPGYGSAMSKAMSSVQAIADLHPNGWLRGVLQFDKVNEWHYKLVERPGNGDEEHEFFYIKQMLVHHANYYQRELHQEALRR